MTDHTESDLSSVPVVIRAADPGDFDSMWAIFRAVVASETTYVFAAGTTRDNARAYWFGAGVASYVALRDGRIAGMYRILANQRDLGSHVANASYMVDPSCAARGIGTAMGVHSLREARRLGYAAMQFNFVVSTNHSAIRLWKRLGFAVVGTLPRAYRHRELGLVDALVMHRFLEDAPASRA